MVCEVVNSKVMEMSGEEGARRSLRRLGSRSYTI
jgi:hypothetical protein